MLGQGDDTYTVRHAPVGTVTLVQGGGGNNTLVVQERPWAAPAGRCCCSAPPVRTTATTPPRPATGWRARRWPSAGRATTCWTRGATQGVILYGGAGDDLIHGGSGNDLIAGGGGNNTIHAGQGNNIVFGNAGLNIDLGTPMDMRSSPDLRSLYALTLVLSPDQAAGQAVGAAADRLAVGGNTITAGDGNNIVFANFGRIVTVTPVNYLRDRGDFIDPAAPGGEARYLAGAGLLALETINVPTAGRNAISVGSGRNVLFGGMGDDSIRAAGGFNLMAGNAAQALYTAAGRILSFASTFPSQGQQFALQQWRRRDDRRRRQRRAGKRRGIQRHVRRQRQGDAVNDRFSVAETLDIAYGGDDILLAGTGGNFMLGGRGSGHVPGSFSKDVMVGDFAAIYFDLSGSRVVNLTRFGPGGNSPDLITRSLEALYSWPGTLKHAPHPVFERAWTQRSVAFLSAGHAAQDGGRVSVAPERPDIVIERHDGGISIYAAGDAAPGVVSMRWRGRVGRGPKHGAVRSG